MTTETKEPVIFVDEPEEASPGHSPRPPDFMGRSVRVVGTQKSPNPNNDPHAWVRRGELACCGTCLDARGIEEARLLDGARRSSLEELTAWTLWAETVLTF